METATRTVSSTSAPPFPRRPQLPIVYKPQQSKATTRTAICNRCISEEACLLPNAFKQHVHGDPQHREMVFPWMQSAGEKAAENTDDRSIKMSSSRINSAIVMLSKKSCTTEQRTTVTTRLLTASRSTGEFSSMNGYGTTNQPRRHSILRLDSNGTLGVSKGIKKSASVEFVLDLEEEIKRVTKARRSSGSNASSTMPRRLTDEEKEELYRQRPDLEIGPVPYFEEKLAEMERRNQRRLIFATFGSAMSVFLLMILYYLASRA